MRARRFLACDWLVATLVVAGIASPLAARAQAQETLTPYQVATMEYVTTAEIAPDGGHVAYVLSVPRAPRDDEDGGNRSQLHVLDTASGETRAYVTAESGVSQVRWSPHGGNIAFLAKREGDEHRALYMISVHGGEAQSAVAFDDRSIGSYRFSPDGTHVALLATGPEPKAQKEAKKHGFKPEVYEESWRPAELWIAVPFEDEPVAVGIEGHASDLAWSADGRSLAVAVAPTALVDDSYMEKRVWIVDAQSGAVRTKIENEGKLGRFAWKPDGSGLALIAAFDRNDGAAARLLWASLVGASDTVVPTPMLGERERDEHDMAWLAEDRLIVLGSDSAWSTLDAYRFEGGKAVGRESLVPMEGPIWTGMSLSRDGRHAALVGQTPQHPPEVFTLELSSGALARRTDSNPWLADVRLARQEVIRYDARDGLAIEGVLIHPLDQDGGGVPLIVSVHGGPEAHLSNGWLTRYAYAGQVAAGQGYAVFYPNYRGSTGRGLAYLKLSQGDPAGKEFDDVIDGVDHLIAAGLVDRDKVGVTGGSYGGYATAWCATYYSERFAAGVMAVGISNNLSKIGTTDIPEEMYYVHSLKRPWDDWQFFLERSPIYHADDANTPLLILHGKDDTRVDPGQSREMYRHLKLRGKAPVRLVNYPGEGHGNRKSGARFDYSLRMLRWFDHYLMGPGGDPPDWALDYDAHLPVKEADAGP